MDRLAAYRLLCGALGLLLGLAGLALFAGFFRYHGPNAEPWLATGPVGIYFAGFAGSALVAWGGCLLAAARRPEWGRGVGTASALGLVLCGVMRIAAWVVGDYHVWPGGLLRWEAVFFLLAALAFVWLRPPAAPARAAS